MAELHIKSVKPKKGVIGTFLKDKGPKSLLVIEWNRQTRELFNKGIKPRKDRRYCLKCTRSDGKRAYFILDVI